MTTDAVWDIQNALRELHFQDSRLPVIFPNGFYDILTQDAVKIYQQTRELPVTGSTDPVTFRVLMDEVAALRSRQALELPVFLHSNIQLQQGNTDDAVWFVQSILNILSHQYKNIPAVSITGKYDDATLNAVKAIQSANRRESTGVLDTETWNDLVRLFQMRPILGSATP